MRIAAQTTLWMACRETPRRSPISLRLLPDKNIFRTSRCGSVRSPGVSTSARSRRPPHVLRSDRHRSSVSVPAKGFSGSSAHSAGMVKKASSWPPPFISAGDETSL